MATHSEILSIWQGLGERIVTARRRRRWSQLELARRAGISRQTLIRLEAGDMGARLETLSRVLNALSLSLEPLEAIADPASDAVGLSEELARTPYQRNKVVDPRDAADFGDG